MPQDSQYRQIQPPFPTQQTVQPQPVPNQIADDAMARSVNFLRKFPGRSTFTFAVALSFIFSFFPWYEAPTFSNNYYKIVTINPLASIYFLSLLSIFIIRLGFWLKWKSWVGYKKILEYVEIVEIGVLLTFNFTITAPMFSFFGQFLSIFSNLVIFAYITYIKLVNKKS